MFTKKGNVAGFTKEGETVCGQYFSKIKAWRVYVGSSINWLVDSRTQTFPTLALAENYANGIINKEMTEKMKWW